MPGLVILFVLTLLFASLSAQADDKEQQNTLTNGGFETDLSGWSPDGAVAIETKSPLDGKGCLRLGPGKAAVSQCYPIGGLRIVWFGANLKPDSPAVTGAVRARCYDAKGRVVMDLRQSLDPTKAEMADGTQSGLYFKTQAHTASLLVSIEMDSANAGCLYADKAMLVDYDRDRKPDQAPTCDLDAYMLPLWTSETITNETVLMLAQGGKPTTGTLLFTPERVLAVRDYSLANAYTEGTDYTRDGKLLTCTPNSRMTTMSDTDLPSPGRTDFPWYDSSARHVVVTYTHTEPWRGPVPAYQGDRLPHVLQKLAGREPLTIVAVGDSITLGINVSGYMQIPPYMPTWADLFARELARRFNDDAIRVYNTGLGGMTSQWGAENADSAVASLDPDLVLIAFGMNDFWSFSVEQFQANIKTIMDKVQAKRPNAEFILISSMPFDPAYTADPTYTSRLAGYAPALQALAGKGVAFLDMYALGKTLYEAKKPVDLITDPMHPNDFLARWYAQGLVALVDRSYGR